MKLISILFLSLFMSSINSTPGITKGEISPEINLPNVNGENISLSELRGDIVLIDFWASWCGPCRRKHPELVEVYDTFKNTWFAQGEKFQIYSVSLDRNKESWIKAIGQDNLEWTNHVSDLKGWQSDAAQTYNIKSIPSNVLLDKNGVIIGMNYSTAELKSVLSSLK